MQVFKTAHYTDRGRTLYIFAESAYIANRGLKLCGTL